jgi:putative endonuclease
MREYWVYILLCADGSYYTGVTDDIDRRVYEHEIGYNQHCYTFKRRPVKLVYTDSTDDIGGAIYREKQIKRWSHKKKEALINGDEKLLIQLARGSIGYAKFFHDKGYLSPRAQPRGDH